MKIVAGVLIAGLCCLQATAGDLSGVAVPSEDELYDAYLTGEIDYDQYLVLLEMVQYGIDPSLVYLVELLPDHLMIPDSAESADSAVVQQSSRDRIRSRQLQMKYGYYRRLEAPEQSRYQLSTLMQLTDHWAMTLRMRKELTGRERFTGRSVRYRADSGVVRQAEIGTFARTYGLGSAIGYRGKLMDCSRHLDNESFLFPDYGGFNGATVDMRLRQLQVSSLVSHSRDLDHALTTAALSAGIRGKKWRPSLTIAANRIKNRENGADIGDFKLASNLEYAHSRGYIRLEHCAQAGEQREAGTALVEVSHRFEFGQLKATAWNYGDGYLNLAGGGRAASLSHKMELPSIDFDFSDRRAGQTGVLVKSTSDLTKATRLSLSVLTARRNADSSTVQMQSEITTKIQMHWRTGVEYLAKRIERSSVDSLVHRFRAVLQFSNRALQAKTYVGYTVPETSEGYSSWLTDVRLALSPDTKIQLWSNLSRLMRGRIDYWYLFGKLEQRISNAFTISTKLIDRYDPDADQRHQMAFSLEVSGVL